jgi:hypothetical protein
MGSKTTREALFYELLAERLSSNPNDEESEMERGVRLEKEAIAKFELLTDKKVETIGFLQRDDNQFIGCSPDGLIKNKGKYTEAVEVKCLSSKNHLKAVITNQVPDEYYEQGLQQFIVNDDLKTLYFVFYDPRIAVCQLHVITWKREDYADEIETHKKLEYEFLDSINEKIADFIKL